MSETTKPGSTGDEAAPMRLVTGDGGARGAVRSGPSVHAARFSELGEGAAPGGSETIELLMDVGLSVTVELGRTEMAVRDVLSLGPGSVIELRRLATDPVEIFVNNRVVARGEVVVVDDRFGVRITELAGA